MPSRGSLRQCVEMMFHQIKLKNYERLAVVCHPRGKYYTLLTIPELSDLSFEIDNNEKYLVLILTSSELDSMFKSNQTSLRLEEPNGNSSQSV